YNEPIRLAERYLKFNVEGLKSVAASAVGRGEGDVASLSKLAEGGFNRTFTITMRDGLELIARLPYPITVPKRYATASEVATIQFAEHHGFPVPKIYDYSTTAANPVGAEYVIMEKVSGKPLRTRWHSLTLDDKCKVLDQLVQVEAALFSIELPASGSIYHKTDLDPETTTVAIPHMPEDANYYLTPQDTMASVAKREMAWMTHCARPRFPSEALCRELFDYQKISPTPHIKALSDYLRVSDYLIPKQTRLNRFILRHPDLSPNNIFVNDSLEVLGIIDWQHSCVLPVFLHVGIPNAIQNFDDDNSLALTIPRLPDNFAELGPEEQEAAKEMMRRRELHITYVYFTREMNPDHAAALDAPYGLWEFEEASVP
ncbi:MAG: hypothetical protein Q9188_007499, partial [Gyalolechia gomerana]